MRSCIAACDVVIRVIREDKASRGTDSRHDGAVVGGVDGSLLFFVLRVCLTDC